MLKVVSTNQVRLGMFIQEFKGSWIDHPFWKKAFKLEDPFDLKKLQASIIKEVVIDLSKGLDIAELDAVIEPPILPAVEIAAETTPPTKKLIQKSAGLSADAEHQQAKRVINASKKAVASMFHDARMGKAVSTESAMIMVDDIAASIERNSGALISLIRLKNKDDYTYLHSVAVCALMVALSKELGLSDAEIKQAGLAGLLHDIGKACTPMEVLNKVGTLTHEEMKLVKLHPELGHKLLLEANVTDAVVLDVCLHHHEKINGMGYPNKLKSDEISLFARMCAVCDVYDAITSNRPYKAGWEPGVSLQRMSRWTEHFDDAVFNAFVKSVGIYPIGSMVKLKSGRLAVVIDQSAKSLLTPILKVFFSTKSKCRIKVELLDLSKPNEQDAIVGHENPLAWGITDVNKIWSEDEVW